jgi:hypothetical protein
MTLAVKALRLMERLSARVRINPAQKGGTLEIRYADDEDLTRIYGLIVGEAEVLTS